MRLFEIARVMIFTIPLGIFTTLTLLLLVINIMNVRKVEPTHNKLFFLYLSCASITSALFLRYYYSSDFFNRTDVVYCAAVVFAIVLFHHFLYFALRIEKRFSRLHYIVPTILISMLIVAKLFFAGYLSGLNNDTAFYIILAFSALYVFLAAYEAHRFYVRQSIAYGTTGTINHRRVVLFLLEALMFPLSFGLLPFIGGQHPGIVVSILLALIILSALSMNIPFLYDIIRHFTLPDRSRSLFDAIQFSVSIVEPVRICMHDDQEREYAPEPESANVEPQAKRIYRKYSQRHRTSGRSSEIDKTDFESYFRKNKPFLNPHLTINDLLEPLQCNRTYLSRYVNRTYGMNFNRYINRCRLREIDRLLAMPGNRSKAPETLFSQAGFGHFRNYIEAKKQFNQSINT